MKAIIPAAGMGTRLLPHTLTRPKVMLQVAGKPIIGHIADTLKQAGITHLSIIVGYKKERVIEYFSTLQGLSCDFPEQKEKLGLGHAVLYGLEDCDDPVLIVLGDTIINTDYNAFIARKTNTLGVVQVDDPKHFGIVVTNDKGYVISMVEKPENPPGNLAIAGLYLIQHQGLLKAALEKLIRDNKRTRGEFQLTDALKLMMEQGELFSVAEIDNWMDCGKKETLLETNRVLLQKNEKTLDTKNTEHCVIIPPVYISPNAVVNESVIGPNVSISSKTTVKNSVIRDSIIYEEATVENMLLTSTIIGQKAIVKGQLKSLNLGDFSETIE
ncbi:MAG: sugar phosphate nucleotidyltransferase [Candidatus Marinimicrobia bacterium]|nr:sugar phosphate nucleotidyltransferase [Candidatus Neomarinimicrobiota bacterium]MDD5582862.1 sugar phosphate nucleotidyltransferase [Candidatus Neomarinimicrobiota bacterium]